jgi:lipid II:glycine glycyltransferase (peptidoglycan interpeptide bridge formation enzyme)
LSKYKIRFLQPDEYNLWDDFVDLTPQGTLFSKTYWLRNTAIQFNILGCFKESRLVAGVPFEVKDVAWFKILRNPKLTQFLGFHFQGTQDETINDVEQANIIDEMLHFLKKKYTYMAFNNHFSLTDMRPFIWKDFSIEVRYTYVINLLDIDRAYSNLGSSIKNYINKGKRNNIKISPSDDIKSFYELHKATYTKQGLQCPESFDQIQTLYQELKKKGEALIYAAQDPHEQILSMAFIVWHGRIAYCLMAAINEKYRDARSSDLLYWTIMQELVKINVETFDLYGANIPSIASFKRNFGGDLIHYFRVKKATSRSFEIIYHDIEFIKTCWHSFFKKNKF